MPKHKTIQQTIASNGSASDVQAKINSAVPGDTVTIPSGSFSWSTQVTINKALTLQGESGAKVSISGGITGLVITCPSGTGLIRVTGLELSVQSPEHYNGAIEVTGGPGKSPVRLDNLKCSTRDGGAMYVRTFGNGTVLVDHCEFVGGQEMTHNEGLKSGNEAGWNDDVIPGSLDQVYFEDCTFTNTNLNDPYFGGKSALQGYYSSRTVIRHCRLEYTQVDQHGTAGMIGARWFEFYDNTFYMPANGNQDKYFAIRAGSGVIFNNKFEGGPNKGGGAIKFYEEDTGSYPQKYQPGRGRAQGSSPVYVWGNAPEMTIAPDNNLVQLGRDVFSSGPKPANMKKCQKSGDSANGTAYTYQPCPYPHPLASGDQPVPPDPNPPQPSTKFKVGDSVCPSPNTANVRESPAGNLLGVQAVGAVGEIVGGPDWGALPNSAGVYWWNVNFPTGPDGFIGEDNLILAQAPSPPDTGAEYSQWLDKWAGWIAANSPSGSAPYTDWLDEMAGWIEQNPPVADP
jgi:hypothetical protein